MADTAHNCADKALKAVGLSKVIIRQVQYDCRRKMVVADLEERICQDLLVSNCTQEEKL